MDERRHPGGGLPVIKSEDVLGLAEFGFEGGFVG